MDFKVRDLKHRVTDLIDSIEGVVRNEIDEERNPQAKIRRVILAYSGAAAAVNVNPIPLASFVLLTPIHTAMVLHVGKRMGHELTVQNAAEIFKQILGAVGLSLAARLAANILLGVGLPIIGGYLRSPAVFALTYGLGRVAEEYFARKNEGLDFNKKEARKIFEQAIKEGRVEGAYAKAGQKKKKTATKKPTAKTAAKPQK